MEENEIIIARNSTDFTFMPTVLFLWIAAKYLIEGSRCDLIGLFMEQVLWGEEQQVSMQQYNTGKVGNNNQPQVRYDNCLPSQLAVV